jgi:hypothetical protein
MSQEWYWKNINYCVTFRQNPTSHVSCLIGYNVDSLWIVNEIRWQAFTPLIVILPESEVTYYFFIVWARIAQSV